MASRTPPSFSDALREAVDQRGLSLDRISAHLRARGHMVSIATLSYWQSGRSLPSRPSSLRALGALEAILEAPRGSLAHLVPPLAQAAGVHPVSSLVDFMQQAARLEALREGLGLEWDNQFDPISYQLRWYVDERGITSYLRVRDVIRLTAPASTYTVGSFHPAAGTLITVTPILGCEMDREVARVEDSVCITSLRLPDLRVGACHVFEYEASYDVPAHADLPSAWVLAGVTEPVKELYMEATFLPGSVPETARVVERDQVRVIHPRGTTISLGRTDFSPGRLGIEWDLPLGGGA